MRAPSIAAAVLLLLTSATSASADATVILLNGDMPNVGLNDPAPRAPVGGNTGTTLGQQRQLALLHAANIWGEELDSPVPIVMLVSFNVRPCTANAAVLASAGAWNAFADFGSVGAFPGPVQANTWHHSALADKRAGIELDPGEPDLIAIFNINLGNPDCFVGGGWYYGLDANEPAGATDLVAVALHEFGHGLGFQQFASLTTGARPLDFTDVYQRHLLDTTTMKTWDAMTDAERVASAVNSRRVVWNGPEVFGDASEVLALGVPILRILAPAGIAGVYEVGTATFGPPLSAGGLTGQIVEALDDGPVTTDACTAITNPALVAGRIALVARGTCAFTVKAANVQAAGAIAMVVVDNAPGGPPADLGGTDPAITIPAVRPTMSDGEAIRAQLATGVVASLALDLTRRAGTDPSGRVLMNAPNPVVLGSSISHWDPIASPNLLMEPNVNDDLTHSVKPPEDLTLSLFRDIGWFPDADNEGLSDDVDDCDESDFRPTVIVDGYDTKVASALFPNGCTMNDQLALAAAEARTHGHFILAVAVLVVQWYEADQITFAEGLRILTAAVHSDIGKKPKKGRFGDD